MNHLTAAWAKLGSTEATHIGTKNGLTYTLTGAGRRTAMAFHGSEQVCVLTWHPSGMIAGVLTEPPHRGNGVGCALVRYVKTHLKSNLHHDPSAGWAEKCPL